MSTVVDSNAPHILLVEDNPADMRLTLEALKEAKVVCNLHWVKDGVEALDYLHRRNGHADSIRPDLILLDLNLPRLDGREVLAEIKAHPPAAPHSDSGLEHVEGGRRHRSVL